MTRTKLAILVVLVALAAAVAVIGVGTPSVTASPQREPELEDFVPSEELPSDSAVAFPVDI